jgi:hypothetical protein
LQQQHDEVPSGSGLLQLLLERLLAGSVPILLEPVGVGLLQLLPALLQAGSVSAAPKSTHEAPVRLAQWLPAHPPWLSSALVSISPAPSSTSRRACPPHCLKKRLPAVEQAVWQLVDLVLLAADPAADRATRDHH